MLPRSPVRPAMACAVLALASTSAICAAASPPAVPPVAEIPVAPIPAPKRRLPPTEATPPTTVTTTTTTTTVPSLAAVTVEPTHVGATELMPAAPTALSTPPHVVLVDELPFRATKTHARELPEHEHAHHGKKKGRHGRPFHPAPGIVVDINDATGGASAADLQRTGRNVGYWPFRHCYEEGLRRDQHMGGKVDMDLSVAPGGGVDRASILGATLHDESVVLCVAREAQHLALTSGESPTSAKMELTLSTGDEPVPEPHPVPHADELRDALRASWPAVKQCYAGALARHADDGGRLELRFRVKSNGEVAEVAEGDTRFGDVEVTRCVLGVYRGAKLANVSGVAHGSHDASFVYAMHLEARPEQGGK